MLQLVRVVRTLATLDLYEVPLSKPQPSGRLRTRAFLLLFVGSIAGYSAWLFSTAQPSAVFTTHPSTTSPTFWR